jgi:alkylation response protein AidB-like acyl-CoA dehydrogenase
MAKACAAMGRITVEANMGAIGAIAKYGTPEQLKIAADLVLAGDKPAICISEPRAGSAASEMTTRADKRGDHYVLNGEKYWITGGGVSKLHLIFARVFEDGVEQGIGGFICVRDGDAPAGLVVGRRLYAMGVRGIPETHLEFHDLVIHKSMLVVPPGGMRRGFASLMTAYNAQRVGAGTVALGIAQGAFEEGLAYLKTREQFGRPIAEFQGLQWMLADMSTQLEAARLLLRYAAASGEQFPDIDKAARAKIFAAETANKVTNDSLQFFGSSGYGRDNSMERHVRDARMFTIAGGTAQILRTQVASKLLGMKLPQTRDGYLKGQKD